MTQRRSLVASVPPIHALVLAVAFAFGCSDRALTPGDGSTSSDSTDSTGSAATSTSTGDSTGPGTDASSSSTGVGENTSSSGTTGCIEGPTTGRACDYVLQDCPAGQKCVRIAGEFPGEVEDICVAVVCEGLGAGEPCTRNEQTGVDDCSPTTFCATQGFGTGICADFCAPDYEEFSCEDPTKVCVGSASQGQWGCFPRCDPLADECPPMTACRNAFPNFHLDFACQPASSDRTATNGQACYGPTENCAPPNLCYLCASGYVCADHADYGPDCDPEVPIGCCTEYCDVDAGGCSNPLHECRAFDGLEVGPIGYCGVPQG